MRMIRRANERFHTELGWLDSWHTFSFGEHRSPNHAGFRVLRVINDDRVAKGGGFPTHGHADMEIISYVVDGGLGHKDSMGNGSAIVPGDVQRMSAGTGVMHSEMNVAEKQTHFLQIWIIPDRRGYAPSYEQKRFTDDDKRDRLRLVVSGKPRDGSLSMNQDVDLYAATLSKGAKVEHHFVVGRHGWLHVVDGHVRAGADDLVAGDGVAFSDERGVEVEATSTAHVLLFDLP